MAQIKKNQLANIVFPVVDATDFATIESTITASDFDSGMTKKFYGVTHGNSTAFTSGTISKAITLVHSGIFQQTLKPAETNYDYVLYQFAGHPSLADQLLVFQTVTYDDSDVYSQLSDIGSNLLSYLAGISDAVSNVQSTIDSQFVWTSAFLSDMNSDLASQIGGITATVSASDISDIASAVWAAKYTANSAASSFGSLMSDVYSRVVLVQADANNTYSLLSDHHSDFQSRIAGVLALEATLSNAESNLLSYLTGMSGMLSDVQSALDSQFVWSSNFLSDMLSDLTSQIGGIAVTVTSSDMSDIASRVWATAEGTRVDSRILVLQSNLSDVDSQLLLNASMISDVYSLLSDHNSDFQSRVAGTLALEATLSNAESNLLSYLTGMSGMLSDVQSALDSQFVWTSAFLSDMNSDLGSKIGNVSVTLTASDISDIASAVTAAGVNLTASDMSDIASRVWATAEGTRVDSRILVLQSMVSDVDSQLLLNASMVSDVYSLLSDHHSDFQSRVTGTLALEATLSNAESNLLSYLTGMSGMLSDIDSQLLLNASMISDVDSQVNLIPVSISASDMSDIASRVWTTTQGARVDSRIALIQSNVSDIESQLDLTASALSDVESAVDAIMTTQMTESYAADGAAPTPAQALMMIQQMLTEFAIASTTLTVKKVDGSTTAATFTLDDATTPTSLTRAS